MKKIFAEIGLGNETFLSTEIEESDGEYRISGFIIPKKIKGCYIRIWVFKTVFIISTDNGFEIKKKDKKRLKIIFGISGIE
ncbi:MAG: hypothetical protein A3I26_02015 [Candidatus Yanofskybacteria bacterium RIFCSPLOWO2_02_FULL_43_10]|uniref:DUF3977 domain-containing protein n=1 Tax=Candidatus Yanofskybacteria bacterium RIFCSPLOWO2_12_FULL_43_11b TaxID=1802710 RepID=A0A1F8HAI1_9BACT|nr:MAG: hypothetical protein A2742_02780 [Candidatus Yanofskybacteria bacterium RIFCSPHIGHO2_01_FULL_43_32]OGN12061.1 MAG: hypothetical protein A3C69_00545 [Candidatus Yanofskybacteria bacterium RIFCSPHIGHO2_02_FULL_43_12]OGN17564.1 MAG: hypothetical protein A3E34_03325 [Candidatus Yanofskybacteria bacterium RIFCSPHIGHO2_12_FULL_43_11]OGN25081.1 MAG: hypothetical protein A2923_01735 [Candidatus Yanofskybacteria bacterium RIFCSPLOWO2_01_FULL_43_46]OGN28736.1 MAG: hypothetical protein A3I26_02015